MLPTYGAMILYVTFWAMLVVIRYYKTEKVVEDYNHSVEGEAPEVQRA